MLATQLTDAALASMREALTTKSIDAIRVLLSGGARVEYSLSKKTSKKLMNKFACFFQTMDKRGLLIPLSSEQGETAHANATESYEDLTVPMLVMLRPVGKLVRVTSAWMGPISPMPLVPDDCFASILADPAAPGPNYLVWIPKDLAEEAAKHPAQSVITVEGETFKKGNLFGIRVHRLK